MASSRKDSAQLSQRFFLFLLFDFISSLQESASKLFRSLSKLFKETSAKSSLNFVLDNAQQSTLLTCLEVFVLFLGLKLFVHPRMSSRRVQTSLLFSNHWSRGVRSRTGSSFTPLSSSSLFFSVTCEMLWSSVRKHRSFIYSIILSRSERLFCQKFPSLDYSQLPLG